MTITLGPSAVDGLVGFAAGVLLVVFALLLLVSFGHWRLPIPWLTESRAAGVRRFFKLLFFPVFGAVVTNAAAWTAGLLVHFGYDPTLSSYAGVLVGAAMGGAHQAATWVPSSEFNAQPAPPSGQIPAPRAPVSMPAPQATGSSNGIDPSLTDAPVI